MKLITALVFLGPLALGVCTASGQSWPAKTVRIIVPSEVGTPTDVVMRGIASSLQQSLGQAVFVDNRPQAFGIVGMEACVKAEPDGYSLCGPSSSAVNLNPFLYRNLQYETPRQLTPVINLGTIKACIVVHPSVPASTMHELVALARQKPDGINWGSWGSGSFSHLYWAWTEETLRTQFHHVPYKTPGQVTAALLSGEVQVLLNTPALMGPLVKAGKLRAIAVTGTARSEYLPGTASFKEQGLDLDYLGWIGLFAPVGTPREVVTKVNAEVNRFLKNPNFVETIMRRSSVDPIGGTPEEFAAFVKADRETAEALVKLAKIKPE
jgi:tripartite-type tricarboxylate transporter receptor subunit TctC